MAPFRRVGEADGNRLSRSPVCRIRLRDLRRGDDVQILAVQTGIPDAAGERAGRHGPRLPRRPPGWTARVTRDPAAHTQARDCSTIAGLLGAVDKLHQVSPISTDTGNSLNNSAAAIRSCRSSRRPVNTSRRAPPGGSTISALPQSAASPPP